MSLPGLRLSNENDTSWIIRYKLYHIPFWFLYHYLSWSLIVGSLTEPAIKLLEGPLPIKFFFYIFFQAVGVYFNLYFLIPRLLEKGRYTQYLCLLVLTILATAMSIVPGYYATAWMSDKSFFELFGRQPSEYMWFFKINALPSTIGSMTLAMSVKLAKSWIKSKQREEDLKREKVETELQFLKSQFNPHFLFNTINSIFVLINKNSEKASDSLAMFSGLLRYQLYECNEQYIRVKQELEYVANFIELAGLRLERSTVLKSTIYQPDDPSLAIAPFILMPFIENAFKHVSQSVQTENRIEVLVKFNGDQIFFRVVNSKSEQQSMPAEPEQYRGIGLQNVKRRLNLLYPGSHQLKILETDSQFEVNLSLTLISIFQPVPAKIHNVNTHEVWN